MTPLPNYHRVPATCGVWSKLRPVKDTRELGRLLSQYLNEETKPERELAPFQPVGLRPGRDYTPFGSGIWVFGHLATGLSKKGVEPAFAQPAAVIEELNSEWANDQRDAKIKAHHITASFAPRIASQLHSQNYPVDAMLLSVFHQTMTHYAARFYPGQTLGFVVGCHHDRDHPHIHALVHPRTNKDELLRVSGLRPGEAGEDKFNFLRERFNHQSRQLFVSLTKEQQPAERTDEWLLLSGWAMAESQGEPDRVSAASTRFASARNSPAETYQGILGAARDEAARSYHTDEAGTPDPARVRTRFSEVVKTQHAARETALQAGLAAFKAVERGTHESNSYRACLANEDGKAVAPALAAYARLAGDEKLGGDQALAARRLLGDLVRTDVSKALEEYRSAVNAAHRNTDEFMVQLGHMAAQVEMASGMCFGKKPTYISSVRPIETTAPVTDARVAMAADRELGRLAKIEEVNHAPADAESVPSLFGSPTRPSLRALLEPNVGLRRNTPTLSL